jgi:hypothetical protein
MGIPYKEKGISVISIIVAVPMTNRALSWSRELKREAKLRGH